MGRRRGAKGQQPSQPAAMGSTESKPAALQHSSSQQLSNSDKPSSHRAQHSSPSRFQDDVHDQTHDDKSDQDPSQSRQQAAVHSRRAPKVESTSSDNVEAQPKATPQASSPVYESLLNNQWYKIGDWEVHNAITDEGQSETFTVRRAIDSSMACQTTTHYPRRVTHKGLPRDKTETDGTGIANGLDQAKTSDKGKQSPHIIMNDSNKQSSQGLEVVKPVNRQRQLTPVSPLLSKDTKAGKPRVNSSHGQPGSSMPSARVDHFASQRRPKRARPDADDEDDEHENYRKLKHNQRRS